MALLAKRVRALDPATRMASASAMPSARDARSTWSKMAWHRAGSIGIGASDLDAAEARRTGAVARAHDLLRLALAAVGRAPQHPVRGSGDGGAGVPELRGDAAVTRILQHADAFAVANLPADLAAELEVVALVVDGPAPVGLHVDGVADAAEHFVERLLAGPQAYVRHADERHARPANRRRGLARSHVAGEQAIADDVSRLRGHAFIVEGERAEAGAVLRPRVANHVHDFGAVAQAAQLIEREEAHARVVGLAAQDAVELDGMADRLVDLQAQLRAVEDEVELALGALFGAVQSHGFFGDARGVPDQVPLVDQLGPLKLMLPAEGIRIRALLDLTVFVGQRLVADAAEVASLIDQAAERGGEDLAAALEAHGAFGQGDAWIAAQLAVDIEEQGHVAVHRDGEGIDADGRDPLGLVLLLGRERDVVLLGESAGARDFEREGRGGVDAVAGEIVCGGEAPAAVGQDANRQAHRDGTGDVAGFAVLGGNLAVADFHDARVGVGDCGVGGGVERFQG